MVTAISSWGDIQFDHTNTELRGFLSSCDADPAKKRCVVLRGRENWLARLSTTNDVDGGADTVADVRQEIRALCANWMRMQNVCTLIGAGASRYVTGFVGVEIFSRVRKLLENRPTNEILEKLIAGVEEPSTLGARFEDFLSQLTSLVRLLSGERGPVPDLATNWSIAGLGSGKDAGKRLASLLTDIERAVAVVCNVKLPESELTLGSEPITPHETFLAKLVARDPQHGRGRLFTTNYDTLLEQAMDRLGIFYVDGFSGTVERRFNPATYDLDLYYPGDVTAGRVRRYDKVLHLHKIHGSINWRRAEFQAGDPFGVHIATQPLPTENTALATAGLLDTVFSGDGAESLAILPTAAKFGESITMPYAHLFRLMAHAMRETQTACFVVGYSGWDHHVNRIVEDALTNPGFTCVVVDPRPSKWVERLVSSDYCGRVYVFGGEWAKFEFFATEMLPDLEILKTDLAIARTLRDLQKSQHGKETS